MDRQHYIYPSRIVIPDRVQAVWLNAYESASNAVSRNTSVPVLSNEIQALSLNEDNAAPSPQVSSPSFFQLLETVSPHVQSVLLDKCTVLELSSLAVVSRSLREGALATMAERSLDVRIIPFRRFNDQGDPYVYLMFIIDKRDPSRNMSVEFCNCKSDEYKCDPWPKIKKLLLFCGHARVKRIDVHASVKRIDVKNPIYGGMYPNRFAMRSDHKKTLTTEHPLEEFFVDHFTSYSHECAKLLDFVSPRVLELFIGDKFFGQMEYCDDDGDCELDYKVSAVCLSSGMAAAESIVIHFMSDRDGFGVFGDELMLKLNACSIVFNTDVRYYEPVHVNWTSKGISRFIEQWLRGSREIKTVQCSLKLWFAVDLFCKKIVEALGKLEQAPLNVTSTALDDVLSERLHVMDGKMICEDYDIDRFEGAVISVTALDGRQMTIVVSEVWDEYDRSAGFIDIFPSNE